LLAFLQLLFDHAMIVVISPCFEFDVNLPIVKYLPSFPTPTASHFREQPARDDSSYAP